MVSILGIGRVDISGLARQPEQPSHGRMGCARRSHADR